MTGVQTCALPIFKEVIRRVVDHGKFFEVQERFAQPFAVIAQLRFGDGQVPPDALALGAVAVGQTVEGVQDGTRPLVVA